MSGIYIPGMEMPKDGWTTIRLYPDGTVGVPNWQGDGKYLTTAIPVPDHGRLGDLDELEQAMRNRKHFVGRLSDPDCLVVEAPTIIPEEEEKV